MRISAGGATAERVRARPRSGVRAATVVHLLAALLVPGLPVLGVAEAAAQADTLSRQIRESERRLEEIRAERERLQREMESVRSRVLDVSRDLQNIERQISASRSVLQELEFQTEATAERVQSTNAELVRTRERLREGSAVLQRRLRDAYKMGPLHTVRVLLGAESFTDLINRYRYLRMIASHDRNLVERVETLESMLAAQSRELGQSMRTLDRLRRNQLSEVAELRSVEEEHERTLERFRSRERSAMGRLEQLEADAVRMSDLVEELERRRLEAERRRALAGRRAELDAAVTTSDAGTLDWPVEGELIYRFGRDRQPNGTVLRWNGIGIAAPPGTPVRAVQAGTVLLAGPFEGYGPTVIVSHGNGFYTLYLYLEDIGVVEGRRIEEGQVVGTVGGRDTPEGSHIEFQIRAPVDGGSPRAMDPLRWLRSSPGGS